MLQGQTPPPPRRARRRRAPPAAIPAIWLVSDARNDAVLAASLARLPRGSGLIFRHHHLAPTARRARFVKLARLCRTRGHLVILAGDSRAALAWGASGTYGAPGTIGPPRTGLLRLATAHDLAELAAARRCDADAVLLSPVFATRTHPGARALGPLRFRLLAARATMPVIALGGMTRARARALGWPRWAAIDGLSALAPAAIRAAIVDGESR